MPTNRITLSIDTTEETGNVKLADFLHALNALRTALKRTDVIESGGSPVTEWEIVALSKNSPATIVLEARPVSTESPDLDQGGRVVARFLDYVEALSSSAEPPPELDRNSLLAFRDLAVPVRQGRIQASLTNTQRSVRIEPVIEHNVDVALAGTTVVLGSVEGRLEVINVHRGKRVFRIFPVVGPDHIDCRFSPELLETAKAAVSKTVRVYGEVKFLSRDPFPTSVVADDIQIVEPGPSLFDVRGMSPEATGDMSSEDFIRERRSGW
jgi:hypothetical protein